MDQESEGSQLMIFVIGGVVLLLLLLGGGAAVFFLMSSEGVAHEEAVMETMPPKMEVHEHEAVRMPVGPKGEDLRGDPPINNQPPVNPEAPAVETKGKKSPPPSPQK